MFKDAVQLAKRLSEQDLAADLGGEVTPFDVQVAVVALLVEMAESDAHVSADELTEIVRTMNRAFSLTDSQVGELLEVVRVLRQESKRLEDYFQLVNTHFSPDQRQEVLAMLWRVIAADGRVERFEASFAVTARTRLGLSVEQAVRARHLADAVKATPTRQGGESSE